MAKPQKKTKQQIQADIQNAQKEVDQIKEYLAAESNILDDYITHVHDYDKRYIYNKDKVYKISDINDQDFYTLSTEERNKYFTDGNNNHYKMLDDEEMQQYRERERKALGGHEDVLKEALQQAKNSKNAKKTSLQERAEKLEADLKTYGDSTKSYTQADLDEAIKKLNDLKAPTVEQPKSKNGSIKTSNDLSPQKRKQFQQTIDYYTNLRDKLQNKDNLTEKEQEKLEAYNEDIDTYQKVLRGEMSFAQFSSGSRKKDWDEVTTKFNNRDSFDRELGDISKKYCSGLADKTQIAYYETYSFSKMANGNNNVPNYVPDSLKKLSEGCLKENPRVRILIEKCQPALTDEQIIKNIAILRQIDKKRDEYENHTSGIGKWWFKKSFNRMMANRDKLVGAMKANFFGDKLLNDIVNCKEEDLTDTVSNCVSHYQKSRKDFINECDGFEKKYENDLKYMSEEYADLSKKYYEITAHEDREDLRSELMAEYKKTIPDYHKPGRKLTHEESENLKIAFVAWSQKEIVGNPELEAKRQRFRLGTEQHIKHMNNPGKYNEDKQTATELYNRMEDIKKDFAKDYNPSVNYSESNIVVDKLEDEIQNQSEAENQIGIEENSLGRNLNVGEQVNELGNQ